jgi:PAS domain S-box-containing protein
VTSITNGTRPVSQPTHLPNLEQVMDRFPLTVEPHVTVSTAIALLSQPREVQPLSTRCLDNQPSPHIASVHANCILVVEHQKLVGIFTTWDALRLCCPDFRVDLSAVTLGEVMTQNVTALQLSESVDICTAWTLLRQHQLHQLPVIDHQNHLLGILWLDDLLRIFNPLSIENTPAPHPHVVPEQRAHPHYDQPLTDEFTPTVPDLQAVEQIQFQANVLAQVNDAVMVIDNDHRITYLNRAAEQLHRMPAQEMLRRKTTDFAQFDWLNPQQHPEIYQALAMAGFWQAEISQVLPTGDLLYQEAAVSALKDALGHEIGFLAVLRDISDRKQAEAALRESEQRFRALFEATPRIAVQGYNHKRQVIFWNQASEVLYGYKAEEAMGRQIEDLIIPPEMRDQVIHDIDAWLNSGNRIPPDELGLRRKDDSIVAVYSSHILLKNSLGEYEMYCVDVDLTDRKLTEAALQESQRRLAALIDSLPGIVFASANDSEWSMQYVSEGCLSLTGYRSQELLGDGPLSYAKIVHPEDAPILRETIAAAIAQQQPYVVEYRIYTRSRQERWLWEKGSGVFDANGQVLSVEGFITDITDMKRAEQQIREQAALLDITTDAILVQDLQNQVLFWNKGAERLYGWQAEQVLGKNVQPLLYQKAGTQLREAQKAILEKGEWQGELRQLTRNQQEITVESRWTLVRNSEHQPKSILVVNTDITEKQQLQAQFLRAQRMESVGTLAGGIAHDLNNLLTPILMAAQLLKNKYPDDKRSQELIQILETNAQRGADLIKQVLAFARGMEGKRVPLQMKRLLTEIEQIARRTFPKSIEVRTQSPSEGLWIVSADATQLHQVLMNLCVNARDAMPDGGILSLHAENLWVDETFVGANFNARVGPHVRISITDTGTGIPTEISDRIFEPFFTTKEAGKGTGLGLSTVLGIVNSHGGFVSVESDFSRGAPFGTGSSRGTRFQVYIPAVKEAVAQPPPEPKVLSGNGELILIVDDEVDLRNITQQSLENHNYKTLIAYDGIDAIALYAQHQDEISLVLTDIMMPAMDGLTAMRTIQKINPQVKVIMTSGLPPSEAVSDFIHDANSTFLAKPYTAQELLHALNKVLH